MKGNYIFLFVALAIVGCGILEERSAKATEAPVPHHFESHSDVGTNVTRIENDEVICYSQWSFSDGSNSLQCKFKK